MKREIYSQNNSAVSEMDEKFSHKFSHTLLSLQLQLKTLLEEVGGDHALGLLDALSKLNRSEHNAILSVLTRAVKNIAASDVRFSSSSEEALQEFEEDLYQDLLNAMKEASQQSAERRFEVLPGGRGVSAAKSPINFSEALKLRRKRQESLLN